MKITLCGSVAFYQEIVKNKEKLELLGHEVNLPQIENQGSGFSAERKYQVMKVHFQKIEWSDAILVLNYEKNNIPNYIGANTLLEIGVAFYLNKKIYLLNDIPESNCKEELLGMKPTIINQDLTKVI